MKSFRPLPLACLLALAAPPLTANPRDLPTPPNSVRFGEEFAVLANGNIVVADPEYSAIAPSAGAVYLFRPDGTLLSTLTGSTAFDRIGSWGITVLPNGNFLVESRDWDNGSATNAGAVTFGDADTGVSGAVSPSNSLVGSSIGDQVGGVVVLKNGNYFVASSFWDNGATGGVGAVTWGRGDTGVVGPIGPGNSLIGSATNDSIGSSGVWALANGHAVILSDGWDNAGITNAGAVTWIRGDGPTTGTVSPSNSLVGTSANDAVGSGRLTELTDGHWVVASHSWSNGGTPDVGAVTWGRGDQATVGPVTPANSLIGVQASDAVGSGRVFALSNGAYVVSSPRWDLGATVDVGAITRIAGGAAFSGVVSQANSLHGSSLNDRIGEDALTVLANGNYVVRAPFWDNGATANVGSVTWCNGTTGRTGAVSAANSLVGSSTSAPIGDFVFPLVNGNYLVLSRNWDDGAVLDVGAITFGNGASGVAGAVSASNSLVGVTTGDRIGTRVKALVNGHYAVGSAQWDNGGVANVGAVTWGNGVTGTVGPVTAANSMIGSTANDGVGDSLDALEDGRFVVGSSGWDRGALVDAGAVTWLIGTGPTSGIVSAANSLVGTRAFDEIGYGANALPGGASVLEMPYLDSASAVDSGATLLAPPGGLTGDIPANRAVFGTVADEGTALYHEWDAVRQHLVVAHSPANRVTLLSFPPDALFANGFE